ncbi:MAG: lipoate--protein ligase [Anaerolineaceae bacterium]|nr:lipoate--protein ligase [Anaerolineaceae bacterium]
MESAMLFLDNLNNHDPRINLAFEEYAIRHIAPDEEILLFYINEPSIIIGRNQNTVQEINVDYVNEHALHVVRRLSGGGAVYHDLGNLNFSFIAPFSADNFHNFKKFTEPVLKVLQAMGANAELSGRNDLTIEGKKISGNAQYVSGQRMVSHGTLLYQTDLDRVGDALRVKAAKIESKGIKSVRSRVANISEYLQNPPDILNFRQKIIDQVFAKQPFTACTFSEADWAGVRQLVQERYDTWAWNFGRSPAFNLRRETRYPGGEIEALLTVTRGIIKEIRFFGDFFGQREIAELEDALRGTKYQPEQMRRALGNLKITDYFVNFSLDELVSLLY